MKTYNRARGICEEFSDHVLYDKTRHSLIVNVDQKYFKIIKKELDRLGYTLVFTKAFSDSDTITCAFK